MQNQQSQRHSKAQRYMAKQKLIGRVQLEFRCIPDDRVQLVRVNEIPGVTKVRIPDFITDIAVGDSFNRYGPLGRTKYTEVEIDNSPDFNIRLNGLCSGMDSDTLTVRIQHPERVVQAKDMFKSQRNIKVLNLENFKLTNCKNLAGMFDYCTELEKVSLENIQAYNVENVQTMFSCCENLEQIDLSFLGNSRPKNMTGTFSSCASLKHINLGSIDTQRCEKMRYLFYNCTSLKEIDLQAFRTPKLRDADQIFAFCKNLEHINIQNFTQEKLENMPRAFSHCGKLVQIDMRNLAYREEIDTRDMFLEVNHHLKISQCSRQFDVLLKNQVKSIGR